MYVSICFEFDNNNKIDFDKFCLCKKEKKKRSVYIIDWNLIWQFNQSSILMQNNDNFKQLLFCKKEEEKSCIWHQYVVA